MRDHPEAFDEQRTTELATVRFRQDEIGTLAAMRYARLNQEYLSYSYVWFLKLGEDEYRFAQGPNPLEALAVLHGVETIRKAK